MNIYHYSASWITSDREKFLSDGIINADRKILHQDDYQELKKNISKDYHKMMTITSLTYLGKTEIEKR